MDTYKTYKEKARWELHKNIVCCLEQILEVIFHKSAAVWVTASHLKNHPSKTNKTLQEKQE